MKLFFLGFFVAGVLALVGRGALAATLKRVAGPQLNVALPENPQLINQGV